MGKLIGLPLMIILLSAVPTAAQWANEPAGSSVIYDCALSNSLCGMIDGYNSASYATPGFGGPSVSPPTSLDSFLAAGASSGGGQWYFTYTDRREIYLGFVWATNSEFVGYNSGSNKIAFVSGGRDNSLVSWIGPPGGSKTIVWYQQGEVDNCHIPQFYPGSSFPDFCWNGFYHDGTGWFLPNESGAGTVAAGSGYHKVEVCLKLSSTPTTKDGIILMWVDGQRTHRFTNVNFTQSAFKNFTITPTWDGQQQATCAVRDCTKSWHHYFDHIHLSAPPDGGCASLIGGINPTPPPPPLPPLAPSNLRFGQILGDLTAWFFGS